MQEAHKLLTIREASERLGLREATIRKWIFEKRIAYCKLGRAVRVPSRVIEKLMQESYRYPEKLSAPDFKDKRCTPGR